MLIVSDTGPINYLLLIGHVDVLRILFGEVAIPPAVFRELTRPLAPEQVRTWVENRPDWVTIREARPIAGYPDIDEGEAEAITLAKELDATLLCDDLAGRKAAHQEGLVVSGTLGVLQAAHLRSLLNIDQALDALSLTSFRRADGLFERLRVQTLRLEQGSDQP